MTRSSVSPPGTYAVPSLLKMISSTLSLAKSTGVSILRSVGSLPVAARTLAPRSIFVQVLVRSVIGFPSVDSHAVYVEESPDIELPKWKDTFVISLRDAARDRSDRRLLVVSRIA